MKRFEYMMQSFDEVSIKDLNELGNEGWETCYILHNNVIHKFFIYFKRELEFDPSVCDITIDVVLHDIETGIYKASSRVRSALRDAKRYNKTYLREFGTPIRNFGKKTIAEWKELNNHYIGK